MLGYDLTLSPDLRDVLETVHLFHLVAKSALRPRFLCLHTKSGIQAIGSVNSFAQIGLQTLG